MILNQITLIFNVSHCHHQIVYYHHYKFNIFLFDELCMILINRMNVTKNKWVKHILLYFSSTNSITALVNVVESIVMDHVLDPRLDKTIDYWIVICCFSAKQTTLWNKSKDWLAQNQNHGSEWSNMATRIQLFQLTSTMNNQLLLF